MIKFKSSPENDLYSESLKPVDYNQRSITPFSLGIIWFGMAVQITCFLTMSPLIQYYTIGQLIFAIAVGSLGLAFVGALVQDIGLKYGISFATSITSSFGPFGGRIAAIIRILPSLIFFGLNGYMGGTALNEISKILFNFDALILFIWINAAALVAVTLYGVKGIEIFSKVATPVMIVVGIYMLYTVLGMTDSSFSEILQMGITSGNPRSWVYAACVTIGGYSSVIIGMNDFTKDGIVSIDITEKKWFKSNWKFGFWSIIMVIPAYTFFAVLGNLCVVLTGTANPLELITYLVGLKSIAMVIIVQLFVFVAQLSTNSAANLFPSVYVICSLAPKYVKFKPATIGFAALAVLIQPWKLGSMLDSVLAIMGVTAGPVLAIILVDYFYFRKRKLSLDDLYSTKGKYYYWKGFNPAALIAYVFGTAVGMYYFDYNFPVSMVAGGASYYLLAIFFGKKYPAMVEETAQDIIFEQEQPGVISM